VPPRPGRTGCRRLHPACGFTLLELLIVITLIAIASSVASLALRDPDATRLEREATRLAALFEAARAQSRALGVPVLWRPGPTVRPDGRLAGDFQFQGLPPGQTEIPTRWLDAGGAAPIQVELPPAQVIVLGPEPVIGAQRLVLRSGTQALALVTDGLGPFTVSPLAAETP
jgi:general secretion pathway protein H